MSCHSDRQGPNDELPIQRYNNSPSSSQFDAEEESLNGGDADLAGDDWARLCPIMDELRSRETNPDDSINKAGEQESVDEIIQQNPGLFEKVPEELAMVALRTGWRSLKRKSEQQRHQEEEKKARQNRALLPPPQYRKTRLTHHHTQLFHQIRTTPVWDGLVSTGLLASLTSLEIAMEEGHHLWEDFLPKMTNEESETEAKLTMCLTRLLDSPRISDIYVRCNEVDASDDKKKLKWAETCLSQIGAEIVSPPLYAMGHCMIPEVFPKFHLKRLPNSNERDIIQPKTGVELIAKPTGGFTDIHVDATTVGQSVCVEQCEKVWFMWPPTRHNLALWASHRSYCYALPCYGHLLKGGLMAHTGGSAKFNALTLPAGTLHCVFTVVGGYLYGTNHSSAEDIELAGLMLECQVEGKTPTEDIQSDCDWFMHSVLDIQKHREDMQLQCLISTAKVIRKIESAGKRTFVAWRKFHMEAIKVFENFSARKDYKTKKQRPCFCGNLLPANCYSHFLDHPQKKRRC